MDMDKIIADRRSVRKYIDKPVELEKLQQIMDAVRLAPSACNAQPWRFIAVTDKDLRSQVFNEGLGGLMVPNTWAKSAPAIIVVASDLSLLTHNMAERIQGVQYHLIDIGIACDHFCLKATELGLGTCYIGWFKGKPISKILKLPSGWKVECLITLGYPETVPDPTPRKPLKEIFFLNNYRS